MPEHRITLFKILYNELETNVRTEREEIRTQMKEKINVFELMDLKSPLNCKSHELQKTRLINLK